MIRQYEPNYTRSRNGREYVETVFLADGRVFKGERSDTVNRTTLRRNFQQYLKAFDGGDYTLRLTDLHNLIAAGQAARGIAVRAGFEFGNVEWFDPHKGWTKII